MRSIYIFLINFGQPIITILTLQISWYNQLLIPLPPASKKNTSQLQHIFQLVNPVLILFQLRKMKKALANNVIYVSKQTVNIDTTQPKFFPFLGSNLIHATAHQQITVNSIHAMCNLDNIRYFVPHQKDFQEFVFFGRSNVGKSSLINSLVRKNFVETSKKPGKTKELAFLKVQFPFDTLLVDAPGYGYASDASKHDIMQWGRLIEYYLKNTPQSDKQLIMVLIDIMHGLKETDGMLLNMLNKHKKNFIMIYTKCDRAKDEHLQESIQVAKKVQEKFRNMFYYVHYTSSRTGQGIAELRNHLLYRMAKKMYLEQPQ